MKRLCLSNGIGIELLVKGDKFAGLGKVTAGRDGAELWQEADVPRDP